MYIGYPISLETAFKIFNYPQSEVDNNLYNMLKIHLSHHEIDLYFYDKNVYILGMRLNEFHASNDDHFSVSDAVELMIYYKHKVILALKAASANLSEFNIEVMEGESTKVQNPQPYVIT